MQAHFLLGKEQLVDFTHRDVLLFVVKKVSCINRECTRLIDFTRFVRNLVVDKPLVLSWSF